MADTRNSVPDVVTTLVPRVVRAFTHSTPSWYSSSPVVSLYRMCPDSGRPGRSAVVPLGIIAAPVSPVCATTPPTEISIILNQLTVSASDGGTSSTSATFSFKSHNAPMCVKVSPSSAGCGPAPAVNVLQSPRYAEPELSTCSAIFIARNSAAAVRANTLSCGCVGSYGFGV